ncbi:MAG: DnaJ domain-containing protein [Treponema sp.]|jgi:Flp pilus assembly protein TadD|nr:DnaJ domain-containing protein [Treponema sp.]
MKTLYDVLGIPKTADPAQIKRGYFNQIRKYPPDHFPEEFKALRIAYETLFDEKKRKEYDEIGAMPEAAAVAFREAQRANQLGRHSEASDLYRKLLKRDPQSTRIKEEYAWSLDAEGKSGKVIQVWESLCTQEPDNPAYAKNLARTYENRGWHRKAVAQFRRALEIDAGDAECWSRLLQSMTWAGEEKEARQVCREALEAVGEHCDYIPLYVHAFLLLARDDQHAAEGYLQKILTLMRAGQITDTMNLHEAVFEMLQRFFNLGMMHLFPYVQEMADMLPDKGPIFLRDLERMRHIYLITTMAKRGFSDLLHDMVVSAVANIDDDDERQQRLVMEWLILDELHIHRPEIARLKKELPELYAMHKNFFDEVLRTHNPEKLIRERDTMMRKLKARNPDWIDDDDEKPEPVRRADPKIGRNDPCPCGSGKKYKRCCGA